MSEQLPAPDFDYQKYERPNQDWVCGWACDGKPCRNGPSPKGECRGKAECRPKLERLSGEEKGRWRCTLPREHGGPCESGPLPDGTCCRAIPPCVPTRSLRAKRGRLCLAVLAMLAGLLLTLGYSSWAWKFVSPGEVSSHHRDGAFVSLRQSGSSAEGCTACHEAANGGPAKWLHAAITANPGPFELHKIAGHTREVTLLDQSCIKCHATHNFHQPGTTRDHSCSACHKEHQGNGPMPPPSSRECASCHNDSAVMAASREKASRLPPEVFDIRAKPGMNTFLPARPKDGRTSVFASFSEGHPEFQLIREKLREENSLKFNHEKHLTGAIPLINGKQLACADCHQPDSAGKYFQRVSFQNHCRSCHSLQFDAENPELSLPHGEATAVRSFLRSLPTQYTELAKDRGITREEEIETFVRDQMSRLRRLAASGENLEQQVFFTSDPAKTPPTASRDVSAGRPRFAGCAYCHEVKPGRDQIPVVTKPIIPDRWMPGGEFNHAKHNKISCVQCHTVHQSRETADIVLPSKDNCASCHSPQGGVSESCAMYHSFHFTKKEMTKR